MICVANPAAPTIGLPAACQLEGVFDARFHSLRPLCTFAAPSCAVGLEPYMMPRPTLLRSVLREDGIEACNGMPDIPLPAGSQFWPQHEIDLYKLSFGDYNPALMAGRRRCKPGHEVKGRVSMVTPSMSSRQGYYKQLWRNFEAQAYPDKELVVIESYTDQPSQFLSKKAKEDSRLVHVCFKRCKDDDFSVGLKRDMTLHLASGEFIVNFDDDDIYGPTYCQRMISEMQTRGLIAITLGSWYNFFESSGLFGYSEPSCWPEAEREEVVYGYGFSYAHRRAEALAHPYPDIEFAEDAPFFMHLKRVYGERKVAVVEDKAGICVHVVHNKNSAGRMPVDRYLSSGEVKSLEVGHVLQEFLDETSALIVAAGAAVGTLHAAASSVGAWLSPRFKEPKASVSSNTLVFKHRRVKSI